MCIYRTYAGICCAVPGRICSAEACAALDVSVLQQTVLPPDVSVLQKSVMFLDVSVCLFTSSQYYPRWCLAYSSLCCTYRRVCLHEYVLYLYNVCTCAFVPPLDLSVYESLCFTFLQVGFQQYVQQLPVLF